MGLFLAAVLAVALAIALGVSGCSGDTASSSRKPPATTIARRTAGVSRDQIAKRLTALAIAPAPKVSVTGAMCYESAAPPTTASYVCPACGTKTLYTLDRARVVEWDLVECRRVMTEIKEPFVRLDESEFCSRCRPGVTNPDIVLDIKYDDDPTTHQIRNVTSEDLRLLRDFLLGRNIHTNAYDEESPLKDHLGRLAHILDVENR